MRVLSTFSGRQRRRRNTVELAGDVIQKECTCFFVDYCALSFFCLFIRLHYFGYDLGDIRELHIARLVVIFHIRFLNDYVIIRILTNIHTSSKSNNSPTPLSTFPAADPNPTASVPTYYNHFQTTGRPPLAPAVDQTVPAGPPYIAPAITATSPSYPETPTSRLLAYLFSPSAPATSYPELNTGYRSLPDYQQRHLRVDDWGEVGVKLQDPIFRKE